MSAATYAVDALTRHQIYLQRYSNGQIKHAMPFLRDLRNSLTARIAMEPIGTTEYSRLLILRNDIEVMTQAGINQLGNKLMVDVTEMAQYEAGFTQRFLQGMVNVDVAGISPDLIMGTLTVAPMHLISGRQTTQMTINQAIQKFAGSTARDVNRAIQTGIAGGQATDDIVREIDRLVSTRTTAQAQALVRTVANHAATTARSAVYSANADIIEKEEFIAVLDNSTTITCAGFDGQTFPQGEGPMPALHFNCRSIRVPLPFPEYVKGDLAGERPAIGADGVTQEKGTTNYNAWLKRQPASFQDEVLGNDRGKLYRNGGLHISKFTDNQGIVYDLNRLKELEPSAFERAGLTD